MHSTDIPEMGNTPALECTSTFLHGFQKEDFLFGAEGNATRAENNATRAKGNATRAEGKTPRTENDTLTTQDNFIKEENNFIKEENGFLQTEDKTFPTENKMLPAEDDTLWIKNDTISLLKKAEAALPLPPTKAKFTPNPQRALWLALLLPGAGQIYNRKYWKLPIFYGGFLGCVYAFTWNQQMYLDYSQAYLDIMDDDPATKSYEAMLPYNYDIAGNTSRLQTLFKKKKDYYRRYRDLSAFCFAGVYLLSVIDAYVDAQLSEFSISEDLSLRVAPAVINNETYTNTHSYGLGCSLNF